MNFTVWVDASSHVSPGNVYTAGGSVTKDRDLPPIINSYIYDNVYNSTGEVKICIDSLKNLKGYCKSMNVKAENCNVNLKTDFNYIKTLLTREPKFTYSHKQEMYERLKKQIDLFGKVECDLIEGRTNIAHDVCHARMLDQEFSPDKEFMDIFRNPEKSMLKVNCIF